MFVIELELFIQIFYFCKCFFFINLTALLQVTYDRHVYLSIVSLSISSPNKLLSIKDHKEIRGASTTSATTAQHASFIALYIYYDPNGIRTTPEEKTFEQLELALVDWYYKYNPTIATKHNIQIYNNEIEKNDATSIEEYNADINRFIIELSQIDQTRLSSIYLEKYLTIESFLYKTKNDISNFQYHSYDPFYYMQIMYNSLLDHFFGKLIYSGLF